MEIIQWLDPNITWHKELPDLLKWHESIQNKAERIKRILGLTITEDPVKTLGLCLEALGLKTINKQKRCHTSSDKKASGNNKQRCVTNNRVRIYQLDADRWKLASEVVESHTQRWNDQCQQLENKKQQLLELIEQDMSSYLAREQVEFKYGEEFAMQLDRTLMVKGKDWDWLCSPF